MNVQAGTDRAPGRRNQVRHLGLDGHRLQAGRRQQLLLRHLLHATIGAAAGNRRLGRLSRLRHPDQLKVTGELADRRQLAGSVRVAAAELANPDPWLGSLGDERHRQRRAGGGPEELSSLHAPIGWDFPGAENKKMRPATNSNLKLPASGSMNPCRFWLGQAHDSCPTGTDTSPRTTQRSPQKNAPPRRSSGA